MLSKLFSFVFSSKNLKNLEEENELRLLALNLKNLQTSNLCLKPEDLHLEQKLSELIGPFLLLQPQEFALLNKYQEKLNEKIFPYYFHFNSPFNAPWRIVHEISLGLGKTTIDVCLDRTFHRMDFVVKEDELFSRLILRQEHMNNDEIYKNMKVLLEEIIEKTIFLIDTIQADTELSNEIKFFILKPADFSNSALEQRALEHETKAIKNIIPEEIKIKIRFNDLEEKININTNLPPKPIKI